MFKSSWSPRERLILLVLSLVQIVHIIDFMILMPLGPGLMEELSISPAQFSGLVSAYGAAAAVAGLLAAFVADRYDRKKVLLFLCVGFGLGTLGCAAASSFEMLLLARTGAGFFGGVLSSVVFSIVGDSFPPERRGHAMGVVMGSFSFASILGVPLGLWISAHWGWNASFVFLALLIVFVIVLGAGVLPTIRGHLGQTKHTPWSIVTSDKNVVWALLFSFMTVFSQFCVIPFISPSMVSNAGMTMAQLPIMYLVGGIVSFFTSPQTGKLCDRRGSRWVFTVGASISLFGFIAITHLRPLPLPLIILVSSFFFFAMSLRMVPAMTIVTGIVPAQKRGALLSLNSCVQQMAIALGSAVAGAIVLRGESGELLHYERVGYLSCILTILALLLTRQLKDSRAA